MFIIYSHESYTICPFSNASGYGRDTIQDESGNDTLQFGKGISASDVLLSKTGNSLTVSVGGGDTVTIDD